jgi:hypothetical protein
MYFIKREEINMDEKTIIKSVLSANRKKANAIISIVSFLLIVVGVISVFGGISEEEPALIAIGIFLLVIFIPVLIVYNIMNKFFESVTLTVTDKRVYGTAAFGNRVDIPIDSISAIGISKITKGIKVASSSGKIAFPFLENADAIHKEISNILLERQNGKSKQFTTNVDKYAELEKLNDLLNKSIITQEEFDKKKKELLNL